METLAHLDTCVAPVLTLEEARDNEHFRAREMFVEYDHPVDGRIVQAAFPLKMTGFEFTLAPAPLHGEHSTAILRAAGYDMAAVEHLVEAGIVHAREGGGDAPHPPFLAVTSSSILSSGLTSWQTKAALVWMAPSSACLSTGAVASK